eukprot:2957235-Rhodomonas_salina.3
MGQGVAAVAGAARSGSVGDGDEDALIDGLLDRDGACARAAARSCAQDASVKQMQKMWRVKDARQPRSFLLLLLQGAGVLSCVLVAS